MIRPNSIIRLKDTPNMAIKMMKKNGVSSAYVVSDKTKLRGVITADDAIRAAKEGLQISDVLIENIITTGPDVILSDIMNLATEARFPIAVVDEEGNLKGILSKVHVLSSII